MIRRESINDLLARDLFLAIDRWRRNANVSAGDDWLRMMIPMNMRRPSDALMPAADVVSTVFLDRRPRDFANPGSLLRAKFQLENERRKREGP